MPKGFPPQKTWQKKIKHLILPGGFVIFSLFLLSGCGQLPSQTQTNINAPGDSVLENQNKSIIPLPSEISIIRTFFELINEQRAADAVSMLAPETVGDNTQKQAWGVQFNAFQKITAEKIDKSLEENWTETSQSYKVTLDVQMKPEAAKAPIPNYGFENGTNLRWVTLKKIDNLWKISGIATGP